MPIAYLKGDRYTMNAVFPVGIFKRTATIKTRKRRRVRLSVRLLQT